MYYVTRSHFLIFIAGVVAVFVVSSLASSCVARASVELDRDVRERVWKREIQTLWWWRGPDLLGVILMIAGIIRQFGIARFLPGSWAVPALAAGLVLVCLASVARAWLTSSAYRAAAPGAPADRCAHRAAVTVTAAELCLAAVVCWYVLSSIMVSKFTKAAPGSSTPAQPTSVGTGPEESAAPRDLFWVDQAEALKLLKGKDAAYLEALAKRGDVRGKTEDGRRLYRRDDISAMKAAGLPSIEELKEDLKTQP